MMLPKLVSRLKSWKKRLEMQDEWGDPVEQPEKTGQPEKPLIDGELLERIDRRDLTPLFDSNHVHHFVPDPDDQTDIYQAEMCDVNNCGIGRLMAK
jgi:hypothetical protein